MTSRTVLTRWGTADHLRLTRYDRLNLCPHEPQLLSPTTLIMLISKIIQQNPRYFSNSAILKMFGVTCGNQRIKDINSEDRRYRCCVHNCVYIPWHNITYIYACIYNHISSVAMVVYVITRIQGASMRRFRPQPTWNWQVEPSPFRTRTRPNSSAAIGNSSARNSKCQTISRCKDRFPVALQECIIVP